MARPKKKNAKKTTTVRIWKTNHEILKSLCPEGVSLESFFNDLLQSLLEYKKLEAKKK